MCYLITLMVDKGMHYLSPQGPTNNLTLMTSRMKMHESYVHVKDLNLDCFHMCCLGINPRVPRGKGECSTSLCYVFQILHRHSVADDFTTHTLQYWWITCSVILYGCTLCRQYCTIPGDWGILFLETSALSIPTQLPGDMFYHVWHVLQKARY